MKRAFVIVMDGCGAGEAPDAAQFGDTDHPATIRHVWEQTRFVAPNLQAVGFLAACGVPLEASRPSHYGRLQPVSVGGKDSVSGHWEMMGIVETSPFPTYPNGFPNDLVAEFESRIGVGVLGNKAASGTEIIAELGAEHLLTGKPILYTSADSVFQVAAHESVIPVDRLYEICKIGREVCSGSNNVERVIARPFIGDAEHGFTRTEKRRDFPLSPPPNLVDLVGDVYGIGVVPDLFDHRGFRDLPRTQSNVQHEKALYAAFDSDARFVFGNFEDFDMLYGHRNDPVGFAGALERFDQTLATVLGKLLPDDILILTADHGNDPTSPSTDHSREYVPAVLIGAGLSAAGFGDVIGVSAIGATVAAHLGVDWPHGTDLAQVERG